MALPVNIKELIEQRVVESTRIEYKSDWNPVAVLHSICAFANDIDNCGGDISYWESKSETVVLFFL